MTSTPLKILLVEDSPADARLVRELLKETGFKKLTVTHAERLHQAEECIKREAFNAIILDLGLPDSQGLDTFARTYAVASDVPILVLTGLPDDELAMAAVREGAQDYLVKGQVDVHQLRRAVQYGIERKRAEAKIRWLTQAVEQSPASVFMTDLRGKIEYVNLGFTESTGYTSAEAIGHSANIFKSGLVPIETYQALWKTILAGKTWRGDLQNRRKNGELYWDAAIISPVRDPRGVATHFLTVQEDVTEQKRGEEALRESEERFRQMAESIKEAFFVVDLATGKPLYVSPTWAEIWGRPMTDALDGRIWFEAVHSDDRAALAADQATVAGGTPTITTFRVVRPDGAMRWVRGRAFPVRDAGGQVYRMVGVSEDITDLRRAQDQMAQAQKMEAVGRLAGGVAHDFNNLLTVIIGESDLAQLVVPSDSPIARSLAEIRKAGERAAGLTRQLLAFSRQQVVEQTVFNLNGAVSDMDKMLRRLIGEDITFETRVAGDAGLIRADRGQMEQVLANLVINARDAMPDGGRLIVETAVLDLRAPRAEATGTLPPGRYVVLSVTDTGIGMGEETQSHIFEPFFTTKERGKGTGLGLSTVYGIVTQSGGQIGVYSEVGLGTTFRIYLPVVEAPVDAETRTPILGETLGGNETVLLVEDDSGVRRLARASLERVGYRVLEAGDPAGALRLADEFKEDIHLLLTDVVMPGMGGQELVARIAPLRPRMKILFTSGYTERAVTITGRLGEAPNFIQKPFTPDELARKVRRVLDG